MPESNTYVLQYLQEKFGSADWSRWSMHRWAFYDYVRLPVAGTSELTFFANPRGTTDPTSNAAKTLEQTNAPKARSFGQVYFLLMEIRTHIHLLPKNRQGSNISGDADLLTSAASLVMPEILQLAGQGVLRLEIGQKGYFEIEQPFLFAPPGFGVDIFQHATSQTTEAIWVQQNPNRRDTYPLTPPQEIEPEQTFNCRIEFPNGNTPTIPQISSTNVNIDCGVIFDGYIIRPAQ